MTSLKWVLVLCLCGLVGAFGLSQMQTVKVNADDSVRVVPSGSTVTETSSSQVALPDESTPLPSVPSQAAESEFSQSTPNDTENLSDPPRRALNLPLDDGTIRLRNRRTGVTLVFEKLASETPRFASRSLRSVDLSGMNLAGIEFFRCEFDDTLAVGANLAGAIFTQCRGTGESWASANLASATIQYTDFKEVSFAGANLQGTTIEYVHYANCDFSGADFTYAKVTGGGFEKCSFRNTKVNFEVGESSIKFINCDFRGADLSALNLERMTVGGCKVNAQTKFSAAFRTKLNSKGPSWRRILFVDE